MNWLNDFNSTNGKIIAGILMAFVVVGTVCGMEVFGKHFNEILLLELLTFIAAWAGLSYVQFAKKRDTFKPAYPPDEDGPTSPKLHAPTQTVPPAVQALQSVGAVRAASPTTPVGAAVAGEGD